MDIPKLNVSVTKAATNGQVVDVVEYDDYASNKKLYEDRTDIAIPIETKNGNVLLPVRGDYPTNGSVPITPGVYRGGCVDFIIEPDPAFVDRYVPRNMITMSNNDDIKDLIAAEEKSKKLDEPFITSPDNITNIPIKESDQPEMIALKTAINLKNTDVDNYAGRFGSNYPNDKRQLKSESATLNIIKRYCKNMDMEAILILKDANPDVPNPMGREVVISLTDPQSVAEFFEDTNYNHDDPDEEDYDD
jgi:hypothetical protein